MSSWISAHEMEKDLFLSVHSYKIRFGARILSRLNGAEGIDGAVVEVKKEIGGNRLEVRVRFVTEDSPAASGEMVNRITKVRRISDGKLASLELYDRKMIHALFGGDVPEGRHTVRFPCTVSENLVSFTLPYRDEKRSIEIPYYNRRKLNTLPNFDELI